MNVLNERVIYLKKKKNYILYIYILVCRAVIYSFIYIIYSLVFVVLAVLHARRFHRFYLNAAGMLTTRFMTRLTGKSIGKTSPPTATWSMRFSPTPGEWWITGTLTLFRCSSGPTPGNEKTKITLKNKTAALLSARLSERLHSHAIPYTCIQWRKKPR